MGNGNVLLYDLSVSVFLVAIGVALLEQSLQGSVSDPLTRSIAYLAGISP